MSQKHFPERQTDTISIRFFSSSSGPTAYPTRKWVVSSQATRVVDATRCSGRFYVQCNCACK